MQAEINGIKSFLLSSPCTPIVTWSSRERERTANHLSSDAVFFRARTGREGKEKKKLSLFSSLLFSDGASPRPMLCFSSLCSVYTHIFVRSSLPGKSRRAGSLVEREREGRAKRPGLPKKAKNDERRKQELEAEAEEKERGERGTKGGI